MKRFTNFIKKCRDFVDREYLTYTFGMLAIMLVIYFYAIYGGMSTAPTFTYAAF